ncbi:MAG: hypothetical protein Q9191_005378 [Dirinaria sp. TL-2023a]
MDPESGVGSGVTATSLDANRRKSRHKLTVAHLEQEIVDSAQLNDADRRLAEMGYVQVYKREFSWFSCISFALSITSLLGSITTTFIYPLEAGGASSAVWCWLISGFGCYCIALSVAELVSAYPTSGGVYFTCKYITPETWIPEIAWLTGWLNLFGQIAGAAATEYGCAQLLLAAVSMGDDFTGYLPTNRQTVGVMAASAVFHGAVNCFNTSALEKITKSYLIFHVAALLACMITLLTICNNKTGLSLHTSEYVWVEVVNNSGWKPNGWSWLFGFLSASWTMTDYDAIAHIAEEIQEPEIKAPWSITIAVGLSWIVGWLFTIVLAYTMGDPLDKLNSPVAQPVAQIFYEVIGRGGGLFFTVAAWIILNFGAVAAIQAGSRTIWAFSRDEMLPLSRIWYKIDKRTDTPIFAVWLFTVSCLLINLVALGSYTAIAAIFNLTAIALDWSYCIPISCKLAFGKFKRGPFHLAWASVPINCWAIVWTIFVTVIYVQPTIRPVTAENMNYVCVLMVAVALFAIVYWYAAGRYYYIGPRMRTQMLDSVQHDMGMNNGKYSAGPSGDKTREGSEVG